MYQAFDASVDFNEGAIVSDVGDFAEQTRTLWVATCKTDPRIVAQLLEAERNTVFLLIELENLGRNFLTHGEHFRWVLDATPCQIGDVQQAVDTAQVHEGAVVGDVFDGTGNGRAFGQRGEKLFALCTHRHFEDCAAANDHVVTLFVELDDFEVELFAFVRRRVLDRTHVDQRAWQEGAHAVRHDGQAAFDFANDHTGDDVALVHGVLEEIPRGQTLSFIA